MKRVVAVAASGGRDSTALLHCTARAARALGVDVVALHVHHGLVADADGWLAQVRSQARRWGCGFVFRRLQSRPAPGDSVEAWARAERLRALAEMAAEQRCGIVLLAQHRRDQAETWLLQALRGGGAAGLSAMPMRAERGGLIWARPWLALPREAIEAYVARHRLRFVDDASNADPRFARNRLRLAVWPALRQAFPDAEKALTAAARQAQHAAALAAEAAAADLPPLQRGGSLMVAPWLGLPPARRRNALRAWLGQRLADVPDSLLDRLCAELREQPSARWPAPGGELRLYRGALEWAGADSAAVGPAAGPQSTIDLRRSGRHRVPGWNGRIEVAPQVRGGVPRSLLNALAIGPRRGGERFVLAPGAAARSLKKQFQQRAVPAWQRDGPLLFTADGRLLFVPGLGVDARLWAAPGEPQFGLRWIPGSGAGTGAQGPGR